MDDSGDLAPILEDLEETGVHVDPTAADWLDADQLAELEANVAASPDPVFVVLADPPDDGGTSWADDLAFRLHDAGGEDGLYLGVNDVFETQPTGWSWSAQQWGEVAGSDDVTSETARFLDYGDGGEEFAPAEGFLAVTGHLADGTFEQVGAQGSDGLSIAADRSEDTGGGGGTVFLVVGALVVVALVVAAWFGRGVLGRRGPARPVRSPRPAAPSGFVLPPSVLDRVREAGDAEAVRRAHAAVLALGERIDATDLDVGPTVGAPIGRDTDLDTASGQAARSDAWQRALDHYDAAGRLLPADGRRDAEVDVLDAVGALVLARHGDAALAGATTGREVDPPRTCFLNPLHDDATDPRPLEVDGRRLEAPLCHACRADLEAGRRPDVLDVVHGGDPVHYFETDREPWASTGFGALDPDLLTRLHGSAR